MDWTSHIMERIPASGTLKMFELANRLERQGRQVYHFEVGQPDYDTPKNIVDAAINALKAGHTRYTPARGIPPLLDAIEETYGKRGIEIDGRRNVIVTPGAKMALFGGLYATINQGDDVLVLSPAWPTYRVMVRTAGGKPIDVPTSMDYRLDPELLKTRANRHVSAIIVNSPNNPTGGVLSEADMKLVYDIAEDYDFLVFSDEIYEALVYDDFSQTSMLKADPSMERTMAISGFSKAYSMTGWRLGYAIGNPESINNLVRIQQNTTSCATSFVQHAGIEALKGDQSFIESVKAEYKRRRDRVIELLCEIEGIQCVNPKGAFYVFPDFSEYGLTSATLAELLLKMVGVCSTPGEAFGDHYDYNLRFSYATDMESIEKGFTKLKKYLETLS